MVLSNKKLKAKFRSLRAESLAAPEDSASGDFSEQLERVKDILGSRKKPRPSSKTGKRRRKPKDSMPVEESGEARKENQENDESIGLKEEEQQQKKKSGKRKREGDGDDEATENEQQLLLQKKKQKKKKKDKKKEKGKGKKEDRQEDEKHEKGNENISGESNERRVQQSINAEQRLKNNSFFSSF